MESKRLLYLPVFYLLWVLLPFPVLGAAAAPSDSLATTEANASIAASQTEQEFQRKWNAETKSEKYHYRNLKEKVEAAPKAKPRSSPFTLPLWLIQAIPILAWVLLIAIALFIAYSIISNWGDINLFVRKSKTSTASVDEESTSEEIDWQGLYLKARQDGDMRMMIRYSFLGILQLLRDKRLIEYRDDKTNFDYLRELKTTEFKQLFKRMTRVYEHVWYGELQLSETIVTDYLQTFTVFREQLKKR
jgi:hypothetical protein